MIPSIDLLHAVVFDGDVRDALVRLGNWDNDFNGENGDEYLWDEAREAGYESNAEYLADYVIEHSDSSIEAIGKFISRWMEDSYYRDYLWDILTDKEGNITCIMLAFEYGA